MSLPENDPNSKMQVTCFENEGDPIRFITCSTALSQDTTLYQMFLAAKNIWSIEGGVLEQDMLDTIYEDIK